MIMIISVVVLIVATTYHCSAQPSIRFRQQPFRRVRGGLGAASMERNRFSESSRIPAIDVSAQIKIGVFQAASGAPTTCSQAANLRFISAL